MNLLVEEELSLDRSSLGLANVLYLTLLLYEIEQRQTPMPDAEQGYRFTILAVEEPESHLHPHLQRLVFRDFLENEMHRPLLLSTHSPDIVSVAGADSLVLLKDEKARGTKAASTAGLDIPDWLQRDVERYLDATRGEAVFARGIALVEGDAELFLLPAFARVMRDSDDLRFTLDGCGISVCNVAGTDFTPYVKFFGPNGLDIPLTVVTDGDRYVGLRDQVKKLCDDEKIDDEIKRHAEELIESNHSAELDELRLLLEEYGYGVYEGLKRGIDIARMLAKEDQDDEIAELDLLYEQQGWTDLSEGLHQFGVFVNSWTLEAELIRAGYREEVVEVYGQLGASQTKQDNMREQLEAEEILKLINRIEETGKGKGRFAQRLADRVDSNKIPSSIELAIKYIVERVAPIKPDVNQEGNQQQEPEEE